MLAVGGGWRLAAPADGGAYYVTCYPIARVDGTEIVIPVGTGVVARPSGRLPAGLAVSLAGPPAAAFPAAVPPASVGPFIPAASIPPSGPVPPAAAGQPSATAPGGLPIPSGPPSGPLASPLPPSGPLQSPLASGPLPSGPLPLPLAAGSPLSGPLPLPLAAGSPLSGPLPLPLAPGPPLPEPPASGPLALGPLASGPLASGPAAVPVSAQPVSVGPLTGPVQIPPPALPATTPPPLDPATSGALPLLAGAALVTDTPSAVGMALAAGAVPAAGAVEPAALAEALPGGNLPDELATTYTVSRAGWRRKTLRVDVRAGGPLPEMVLVARPGTVPPRGAGDGHALARLAASGAAGQWTLEVSLDGAALPWGVRLIPAEDGPAPVRQPPDDALVIR
jgi:hypothetical protein